MQELPKPITKLTWDNAALVSPKFAQKQDFSHKVMARGGEHGQIRTAVVDIALNGSKVSAATWTLPGQAENTVVLPLGYGRKRAGYTGTNKGFNAYEVRTSNAMWSATGGQITATGDSYPLACTQYHFNMEGRQILSTGTLEEYKKNPGFAHEGFEMPAQDNSLYKQFSYQGHAWGMAIDLNEVQRLQRMRGGLPVGEQYSGGWQGSGDARAGNALDPHRPVLHAFAFGHRGQHRRPNGL